MKLIHKQWNHSYDWCLAYLKLSFKFPNFIGKLFGLGFVDLGFLVPHRLDFFPGLRFPLNFGPKFRLGLGQPVPVFLHLFEFVPKPPEFFGTDDAIVQPDAEEGSQTGQLWNRQRLGLAWHVLAKIKHFLACKNATAYPYVRLFAQTTAIKKIFTTQICFPYLFRSVSKFQKFLLS